MRDEPDRLPPPSWRTRYFALDVVLLSDGETVHNAFLDEDFG
jgi:hypothetical protein